MPITKQDIQQFGNTLKDTLTTWGEQIQYGRDVSNLKKIQDKIQNVKSFSTDANGNPLSMEDVGKKLFSLENEITSTIRNPTIMAYAKQNVGDFFKSIFLGAKNTNQNQLEMNEAAVSNPRLKDEIPKIMNGVQSSWVDVAPAMFKASKDMRPFSPHYRTQTDPNDPMKEQDIEIMWKQNPETGQWEENTRVVAERYRTKETPDEIYKRNIDTRATPTTSRNFNSSPQQFQIATGTDKDGNRVQVKVGSYGTITDMNGNVLKGVDVPMIEFKTGTDTIESKVMTPKEINDATFNVVKSVFKGKINMNEMGKVVSKDKADVVWNDLVQNGRNSPYWNEIPYESQQEIIKYQMMNKK